MTSEELQQKIQEVEDFLESAKGNVQELSSIKEEALNLRRTIQGRATESENKHNEIKRLRANAEQLETQIRTSLGEVSTLITEIKQYQPVFQELKTKVESKDEGIEALFDEVETCRDDASALKKEAENILVDIKGRLNNIEQLKIEASEGRDQIRELAEESESLKDSIQEHLELITDSTLQNAFKEREKSLFQFMLLWLIVSVLALVGFALGILHVFNKLAGNGFQGWHDWYRLLFVTPLLFLVVWSARNYAQERRLHEKYAFKAVISTSLTGYIKLLSDRFEDSPDKILEFTEGALVKIFKEPYENIDSKVRANFSLWNIIKANVELDERTEEKMKEKAQKASEKIIKGNHG